MVGIILLLIMFILYGSIYKLSDNRRKYIIKKKMRNINYAKTFKYWIFIQGFSLLSNVNNEMIDWVDVIVFPILLICLFICSGTMGINVDDDKYGLDYDSKADERDKKLDKLLKKGWF